MDEKRIARADPNLGLAEAGVAFSFVAELFGHECECVTPAQWAAVNGRRQHDSSLHRLLLGVMQQALRDYLWPQHRESARAWVEDDGVPPFGFAPLCEYLGMDPVWLREGFRRWMARVDDGTVKRGKFGSGVRLRGPADSGMTDRVRNRGPYKPRKRKRRTKVG